MGSFQDEVDAFLAGKRPTGAEVEVGGELGEAAGPRDEVQVAAAAGVGSGTNPEAPTAPTPLEMVKSLDDAHIPTAREAARLEWSAGLARRIKASREAAGLTQRQVAARCGVWITQVAQWENGVRGISSMNLAAFIKAVGADPWFLLGISREGVSDG
jgi:DNA-binding transcriptional regulator YiaG